jgi:hypothetical protein
MRHAVHLVWLVAACSSGGTPSPDASGPGGDVCGDGVCNATEIGACPQDCGGTIGAVCGNSMCESGETMATCPGDCSGAQQCGDNVCTPPENAQNCPGDCGTQGSAVCGNLVCEAGETMANCPGDCPGGGSCTIDQQFACIDCLIIDPSFCIPPITEQFCLECLGGGGGGGPCNFDLICDTGLGEDPTNCPTDCP